jgi:hypothetical protein
MFLSGQSWYGRDGQHARGSFLIIFSVKQELRACSRYVHMAQLGHFMMGQAKIAPGTTITLSGTYGDDGLPCDPAKIGKLWETLLPLPGDLTEAFWSGGGHNSAGSEGPAVRDWALVNLPALRKAGRPRREAA